MSRGAEIAKWVATGTAVAGLHVALVAALAPNMVGQAMTAPDPILVDLVEVPSPAPPPAPAPPAEPQAVPDTPPPPEPEPQPEPEPEPEVVPAPSFTPPPLTSLPALKDPTDLFPPKTNALALDSSDRPTPRAIRKPAPQQPERQPTPERTRQAATPPAEPAPESARQTRQPASPQAGQRAAQQQPGASRAQVASWQADVGARIARHMSRTRLSGRSGGPTVQIAISIQANGTAVARLASSTGDARNDAALAAQAGRMPRMPAPPSGQAQSFVLPVRVQQ